MERRDVKRLLQNIMIKWQKQGANCLAEDQTSPEKQQFVELLWAYGIKVVDYRRN